MALSESEQALVNDLKTKAATLSASARAELSKGLSFFRRFAWAACAASAVAGVALDHFIISKLV